MSAPADLVVVNQGNVSVTIQSQSIAANGGTYTVPFGNLAAWATDPYLRSYLLSGVCYIIALGITLQQKQAADWMDAIFRGSIVYAS
jgi:hypothetical protein